MNILLTVNGTVIPLNDFTQEYMGNVVRGIATSLGVNNENEITLLINKEALFFSSDCQAVIIEEAFMHFLIKCTIKGMVSSFEDIPWFETISMTITH